MTGIVRLLFFPKRPRARLPVFNLASQASAKARVLTRSPSAFLRQDYCISIVGCSPTRPVGE